MSFLLFLLSGAFSTALDIGLFTLLHKVFEKSLAYGLSYSICVAIRYLIDSRITFADSQTGKNRFLPYFIGNLVVMLFGLAVFNLLCLKLDPLTAKVLSIPPATIAGFILMRFVVFTSPATAADEPANPS